MMIVFVAFPEREPTQKFEVLFEVKLRTIRSCIVAPLKNLKIPISFEEVLMKTF